jgi:two-component system, NtrC family, sensor kinase
LSISVLIACSKVEQCLELQEHLRVINSADDFDCSFSTSKIEALYVSVYKRPELVIADAEWAIDLFCEMENKGLDSSKILISEDTDFNSIKKAINSAGVCRLIKKPWTNADLEWGLQGGVEYLEVSRSQSGLLEKVRSRTEYLESLKETLEKQEKERSTSVNVYTGILRTKKDEYEVMNKVLSGVPGMSSVKQIEGFLSRAIGDFTGVTDVDIVLNGTGTTVVKMPGSISLPLFCSGCLYGHIVFSKSDADALLFSKEQLEFLDKISDVVAITVERILRLSVLEKLKKQWDAVFSSISDPIIIIDSEYRILSANRSFEELVSKDIREMSGRKCYEIFSCGKNNAPCDGCNAKKTFLEMSPAGSEVRFGDGQKSYNAWTYPIIENGVSKTAVQFYKDVSEQVIYREKLLYSEKMAEIGILAGSVAHEINNPVGGVLALLQVMMRELDKNSAMYEDLLEMEKAAKRCKQIVDNLLHFSRRSRDEDIKDIEVSSIFSSMLPLIELQTRHENIVVVLNDNSDGCSVRGVFNELVQVFLNVVNTSVELISKKGTGGKISIDINYKNEKLDVLISDNGIALDLNVLSGGGEFKSLALFVAKRILKSHNGNIDFERKDDMNLYKISFKAERQNV